MTIISFDVDKENYNDILDLFVSALAKSKYNYRKVEK